MTSVRNKFRIIGGSWRSRSLAFPPLAGLRPTPDRVRETLFNWLRNEICGARCLDLFAGSGAMSFEALSRGAASVTAVEISPAAVAALEHSRALLQAEGCTVLSGDALDWLARAQVVQPFDIVFLDPPYAADCLQPCCELLERHHWLAPSALVYLEDDESLQNLVLPANWQMEKTKRAGQVHYALCRRTVPASVPRH